MNDYIKECIELNDNYKGDGATGKEGGERGEERMGR